MKSLRLNKGLIVATILASLLALGYGTCALHCALEDKDIVSCGPSMFTQVK